MADSKKQKHTNNIRATLADDDRYVSCSFSLPRGVKRDMDERAARLRLTRTDYLKLLVLADLD
jgi:hypothetical protein